MSRSEPNIRLALLASARFLNIKLYRFNSYLSHIFIYSITLIGFPTYKIVDLIRIGQIFLWLVHRKRFGLSIAGTISMTSSSEEEETLKHPFDDTN